MLAAESIASKYSEYAYDYYKYYVDAPVEGNIDKEPDLELMYDPKPSHGLDSSASGSDSEDSNREDHPLNEYPDSDGFNENGEEEDEDAVAHKQYKQNVNSILDKFVRKKANYAGNRDLLQQSEEAEEREYVDEVYGDYDEDA